MFSHDTALPLLGQCSCRLTPRTVSGVPLTRSSPCRMLTVRSPTQAASTSTTVPLLSRSSRTSVYRNGASAVHSFGAGSRARKRAPASARHSPAAPPSSSSSCAAAASLYCLLALPSASTGCSSLQTTAHGGAASPGTSCIGPCSEVATRQPLHASAPVVAIKLTAPSWRATRSSTSALPPSAATALVQ
eukprot:scaffold57350_cov69-Phaeocystis_antarctica.AAC.7